MTFVYTFTLRKYGSTGRWSVTPQKRGQSKRIQGQIALKSKVVVWQGAPTFKEAVPHPPWAALSLPGPELFI